MPKYNLNLSFLIDINAEIEEEISEEQMVQLLQELYQKDRTECSESIRYCLVDEKVDYKIIIQKQNPQ